MAQKNNENELTRRSTNFRIENYSEPFVLFVPPSKIWLGVGFTLLSHG